jgi:hypothetical protein
VSAINKVATILVNKPPVKRVAMVCEGIGINYAHIKLYLMHGLTEEFEEIPGSQMVYYEKYFGKISTLIVPKANPSSLDKLAALLR